MIRQIFNFTGTVLGYLLAGMAWAAIIGFIAWCILVLTNQIFFH